MEQYKIKNSNLDKNIIINLEQDVNFIKSLTLNFNDSEEYISRNSEWGVVAGKITTNNNIGIPNAKVSIFIPLEENDRNTIYEELYPYTSITTRNENGVRYNLLPKKQQNKNHTPVGTFFDNQDILISDEIKYVYNKYYKYTTITNENGEYIITGVPVGQQTIHVDVDLSDIGYLSVIPEVLVEQGIANEKQFDTNPAGTLKYKKENNLNNLPQIKTINKTIFVNPYWGDPSLTTIGVCKVDLQIDYTYIPYALFFGTILVDNFDIIGHYPFKVRKPDNDGNYSPSDPIEYTSVFYKHGGKFTPLNIEYNQKNKLLKQTRLRHHNCTIRKINKNGDTKDYNIKNGNFIIPVLMYEKYYVLDQFNNWVANTENNGLPTQGTYNFEIKTQLGRRKYIEIKGFTPTLLDNNGQYSNTEGYFANTTDNNKIISELSEEGYTETGLGLVVKNPGENTNIIPYQIINTKQDMEYYKTENGNNPKFGIFKFDLPNLTDKTPKIKYYTISNRNYGVFNGNNTLYPNYITTKNLPANDGWEIISTTPLTNIKALKVASAYHWPWYIASLPDDVGEQQFYYPSIDNLNQKNFGNDLNEIYSYFGEGNICHGNVVLNAIRTDSDLLITKADNSTAPQPWSYVPGPLTTNRDSNNTSYYPNSRTGYNILLTELSIDVIKELETKLVGKTTSKNNNNQKILDQYWFFGSKVSTNVKNVESSFEKLLEKLWE